MLSEFMSELTSFIKNLMVGKEIPVSPLLTKDLSDMRTSLTVLEIVEFCLI